MKDINYYKNLKYRMTVEYHPDDTAYFVNFPELPGCIADGATPEEAVKHALTAKDEWLEVAIETGWSIPEPSKIVETSGRITVRTPKSLHGKLLDRAEQEGVSLNQLMLTYLSEGLERATIEHGVEQALSLIADKVQNLEKSLANKTHAVIVAGAGAWPQPHARGMKHRVLGKESWGDPFFSAETGFSAETEVESDSFGSGCIVRGGL